MAFREIEKGMTARFRSLKSAKDFSRNIVRIIRGLYPRRSLSLIQEVSFQSATKTLHLFPSGGQAMSRLVRDRQMIKAALRAEGLDIKRILVKKV